MSESFLQYGKIKSGVYTLDDAVLNLGTLQQETKGWISKSIIYRALYDNDVAKLREISNYFYKTSGIYQKVCNYFASMYRFDWYVVPEVYDKTVKEEKVLTEFVKVLNFLDNSYIKKVCGEISLGVIKNGAYYGYIVPCAKEVIIQELPVNYCRSRYSVGSLPVVEFNMKFFDQVFPDTKYRMKVLNLFPDEFKKGYVAYKSGKLQAENYWDRDSGWWQLDPQKTVKFSINNGGNGSADIPLFINAIPAILDLDAAQDLDRRKQMQKLLKIIVQKLPMDKNGDLVFDVEEARDIHNNVVGMLKKAVGVDVLTTFAEVDSIDMSDKNTTATQDDLTKMERTVFNALGVSKNVFNADGNLALSTSILNDEGSLKSLLFQLEIFFDRITQQLGSTRKKFNFRLYMLQTTQYNYKELSKMYKEQVQLGYSKMLPQIALGHSQSSILNTAYFENEVLHLSEIMIPPLMSSTMSMEDLKGKTNETQTTKNQQNKIGTSNNAGRPEKEDSQKSDKTIQNKESMS